VVNLLNDLFGSLNLQIYILIFKFFSIYNIGIVMGRRHPPTDFESAGDTFSHL